MNIRTKLILTLYITVAGILLFFALIIQLEIHHCFGFACQVTALPPSTANALQIAFNQALMQSLMWVFIVFVIVTGIVVWIVTRMLTKRIVNMQRYARQIAEGKWDEKVPVRGSDELSSLATTLNYLSEQLTKQEELRKHMMQDVAHELRTPLSTLRGYIQAFYDGLWEPNQDRLQSCMEEIERFQSLVSTVETLSDVESMPVTAELVDLRRIAQSITQLFEPVCKRAELQLNYNESTAPVFVLADPEHLSQIVRNLLDNAIKFTPSGGTVSVFIGYTDNSPFLQIDDTGIGIPVDELQNIFERFYRIDKSRNRKTGGSGLGLAIVKKLLSVSGGKISVTSKYGEGTTFTIQWPPAK